MWHDPPALHLVHPMQLHNQIMVGMTAGAVAGVAANALAADAVWVTWLADYVAEPVGNIFLRMLLMTVVPLVFASITLGVASFGDVRRLGRVGIKTLAYFLLGTALAVALGLTLVNAIDPGAGVEPATREALLESYRSRADALMPSDVGTTFGVQMLVDIVPRNPVEAAASMDMLGLIFFSLVFGAALTLIPRNRAEPLIAVIDALGHVVIRIIQFTMKLAPYGVFGLIFVVTSRFGWHLLQQLGIYVGVVIVGLALHGAVVLSLLVGTLGGIHPVTFWKRSRASIVTAFSTSSSNATLPTNIAVAERELGVPPAIAGFVLPLGATMNMNGTALYEGVTVLFLAQVFGVDLNLGQQVVVALLAVITAVGAAGVPGGSLPLMMVVMGTVGVPPEGIAIILGVDRILDMSRTTLNVAGDLTAALFVARSERAAQAAAAAGPAQTLAVEAEQPPKDEKLSY
jgi:DAACS family dicarboxylate/amino acid:cation (Na+ or H+) symporter